MYVCDPLLVVAPDFDHCHCRPQALVKHSNCAIAVAAYEDVAGYLIGGERGDTGAGAGGDVLYRLLARILEVCGGR